MLKSALRKIYLDRRKSLSAIEREKKSRQLADLFFDSFDLSRIKFLHCFLPIEKFGEINTRIIFERIWRDFSQIETVAPSVNFQTDEIESLVFQPDTNLVQNVWRIDEPMHNKFIETGKIDLVVVPLLCFDERGFRVGYGKGFYDKFLKNCRADCLKVGLSYFAPVDEIADAEVFDVRLNSCLTPPKKYKFA